MRDDGVGLARSCLEVRRRRRGSHGLLSGRSHRCLGSWQLHGCRFEARARLLMECTGRQWLRLRSGRRRSCRLRGHKRHRWFLSHAGVGGQRLRRCLHWRFSGTELELLARRILLSELLKRLLDYLGLQSSDLVSTERRLRRRRWRGVVLLGYELADLVGGAGGLSVQSRLGRLLHCLVYRGLKLLLSRVGGRRQRLQLSEAGARRSLASRFDLRRRCVGRRLTGLLCFRELTWGEEFLDLVRDQIVLFEAVIQRPISLFIIRLDIELC